MAMNVKQLKNELAKLDEKYDDTEVLVDLDENGFFVLEDVKLQSEEQDVVLNLISSNES